MLHIEYIVYSNNYNFSRKFIIYLKLNIYLPLPYILSVDCLYTSDNPYVIICQVYPLYNYVSGISTVKLCIINYVFVFCIVQVTFTLSIILNKMF